MTERTRYRVVGIRADQSRMVICEHITMHQAQRTKQAIASDHVFPSVEIEAEDLSSPDFHLIADN